MPTVSTKLIMQKAVSIFQNLRNTSEKDSISNMIVVMFEIRCEYNNKFYNNSKSCNFIYQNKQQRSASTV